MNSVEKAYRELTAGLEPELAAMRRADWSTVTGATERAAKNPARLPEKPHRRRLKAGEANPVVKCGCGCGRPMELFGADGYERKVLRGHGSLTRRREKGKYV